MLKNKIYKKLYRKTLQNYVAKRRLHSLWLDRRSERHIQIMAAQFFIGFFLTIGYGYKTLLTWTQISQIYFGLAVVFSFIPINWLPHIYRIRKELKILLGVCALAPLFTGLVLISNFYIGSLDSKQTVKVINYHFHSDEQIVTVDLENNELNKHLEIRKFPLDKLKSEPDSAVFIIYKGVFGIKIVHDSWILSKK